MTRFDNGDFVLDVAIESDVCDCRGVEWGQDIGGVEFFLLAVVAKK
jgi:hypothetical protein